MRIESASAVNFPGIELSGDRIKDLGICHIPTRPELNIFLIKATELVLICMCFNTACIYAHINILILIET